MWGGCTGGEKERKWRKWGEEEEEEEKWRCVTDYIWKKLWFPGFKQCGKGFEEIYCYTHEHTNFVLLKLCKKLYRNLTESFFIASSSSISSLPCSSDHFPSSAQLLSFLLFLLLSTVVSSSFSSPSLRSLHHLLPSSSLHFFLSTAFTSSISSFSPCFFISPTSSSSSLPILVFFQTSPLWFLKPSFPIFFFQPVSPLFSSSTFLKNHFLCLPLLLSFCPSSFPSSSPFFALSLPVLHSPVAPPPLSYTKLLSLGLFFLTQFVKSCLIENTFYS